MSQLQEMRRRCRFAEATTGLPALIRDLHTTLAAGHDVAELLPLAVYLRDAVAAAETAAELALRFGETGEDNSLGFAFGPTDVGMYRMAIALEAGEPDQVVHIAETIEPARHPFKTRQYAYWIDYGRALARLPRRGDDAVKAFRKAELLFSTQVQCHPFVADVFSELLSWSLSDAVRQQLRRMAYRGRSGRVAQAGGLAAVQGHRAMIRDGTGQGVKPPHVLSARTYLDPAALPGGEHLDGP